MIVWRCLSCGRRRENLTDGFSKVLSGNSHSHRGFSPVETDLFEIKENRF
jgi:hypothetical protein